MSTWKNGRIWHFFQQCVTSKRDRILKFLLKKKKDCRTSWAVRKTRSRKRDVSFLLFKVEKETPYGDVLPLEAPR